MIKVLIYFSVLLTLLTGCGQNDNKPESKTAMISGSVWGSNGMTVENAKVVAMNRTTNEKFKT